ncbi:hypothetical protein BX600DRAFT_506698 [Xylariales sp. PMI_506]|nr:hypothetical protein BX600DRAFT_506698 [Xylariales sp. PMI_506]
MAILPLVVSLFTGVFISRIDSIHKAVLSHLSPGHSLGHPPESFICQPHDYTVEVISLDPLVVYIPSFLTAAEVASLLDVGAPSFKPSEVTKRGRSQQATDRTSSSAGLPADHPAVQCVLDRARDFLGPALFDPARGDMEPPQLVRYAAGQRFNVHHDWYSLPHPARLDKRGLGHSWNRQASFFAILEDECAGGETWFPYITIGGGGGVRGADSTASSSSSSSSSLGDNGGAAEGTSTTTRTGPIRRGRWWREHEDGGIAFRPASGNAIFWVNLHQNGTGDERVKHAGLPVMGGVKTGMNIWPRVYYS